MNLQGYLSQMTKLNELEGTDEFQKLIRYHMYSSKTLDDFYEFKNRLAYEFITDVVDGKIDLDGDLEYIVENNLESAFVEYDYEDDFYFDKIRINYGKEICDKTFTILPTKILDFEKGINESKLYDFIVNHVKVTDRSGYLFSDGENIDEYYPEPGTPFELNSYTQIEEHFEDLLIQRSNKFLDDKISDLTKQAKNELKDFENMHNHSSEEEEKNIKSNDDGPIL